MPRSYCWNSEASRTKGGNVAVDDTVSDAFLNAGPFPGKCLNALHSAVVVQIKTFLKSFGSCHLDVALLPAGLSKCAADINFG